MPNTRIRQFYPEIDGSPEHMIPKDEKRQLIDTLFYRMVLTARQGSEIVGSIRENVPPD